MSFILPRFFTPIKKNKLMGKFRKALLFLSHYNALKFEGENTSKNGGKKKETKSLQ
jgi:hypothetical protein